MPDNAGDTGWRQLTTGKRSKELQGLEVEVDEGAIVRQSPLGMHPVHSLAVQSD